MGFKNLEALEAYDKDPKHIEVKSKYILPLIDKSQESQIIALDFDDIDVPTIKKERDLSMLGVGFVSGIIAACTVIYMRSRL